MLRRVFRVCRYVGVSSDFKIIIFASGLINLVSKYTFKCKTLKCLSNFEKKFNVTAFFGIKTWTIFHTYGLNRVLCLNIFIFR